VRSATRELFFLVLPTCNDLGPVCEGRYELRQRKGTGERFLLALAHFRRHDLRELHDHHLTSALAVPAVATVAVACARKV
jgi:hypothetical protein